MKKVFSSNHRSFFVISERKHLMMITLTKHLKKCSVDAFDDAYEFLMGMYASNAGKSGGEYFTPQEVSELLTRIAVAGKTEVNKVYDIKTPRLIQFNYFSADFAA